MDYSLLAGQLLNVQANLLQVPAYQQLSKMVRGELFVLNYLATHETAIHPKELSKKMAVSTARLTFLLHHMEEKGLIARSSDLSDNRQIFVRLTYCFLCSRNQSRLLFMRMPQRKSTVCWS